MQSDVRPCPTTQVAAIYREASESIIADYVPPAEAAAADAAADAKASAAAAAGNAGESTEEEAAAEPAEDDLAAAEAALWGFLAERSAARPELFMVCIGLRAALS